MNAQTTSDGFKKWEPINAHYTDPEVLRAAMFAQSAATRGGVVAGFHLTNTQPPVAPELFRPIAGGTTIKEIA